MGLLYGHDSLPGNGQIARCVDINFETSSPTLETGEPTKANWNPDTPEPTSAAPTVFFDNDYELTLCKKTSETYSKITGTTTAKKLKKKGRDRITCETKKHAIEMVTASLGREQGDNTCASSGTAACATNIVDGKLMEDLQQKCNGKH